MLWIYLGALAIFDAIGMYTAKQAALGNGVNFFIITMIIFAINGALFSKMMEHETLVVANILWFVAAVVLGTLLGLFVFHEKVSVLQWAGILVCIGGLILIQWPTK